MVGFVISICALLAWAIPAFLFLPGAAPSERIEQTRKNVSVILGWRPRHRTVATVVGIVGVIGIILGLQGSEQRDPQWWQFITDLAPEMVGMAFTVFVIDELNQRRLEQQEKERIIKQMGSSVNDAALEAVRLAGGYSLKTDGALKGANLRAANLKKAFLPGADLEGAKFFEANLERANLEDANLKGADLYSVNLKEADLSAADLRGADLRNADLRYANLSDVNLTGAKYNNSTQWPKDFAPNAVGAIKINF